MGKDGGIGEITLTDMLAKIYDLERINEEYEQFLDKTKNVKPDFLILFEYLSILKKDPQLPFRILPGWWLGEKAHQKYEKIMHYFFIDRRGRDSQ